MVQARLLCLNIFLASGGSAEIALRIRALRGMGQVLQLAADRSAYESLWKDMFSAFDQSRTIHIELKGSSANTRSLTIAYSKQLSLTLPLGQPVLDSPLIIPIVFEWKNDRDQIVETVEVNLTKAGLTVGGTGESIPAFFFAGTAPSESTENATRFSDLDKEGRARVVVNRIREEFSDVEDISVQIAAGVPGLYGKVKQFPEKFPVGVLSGGINKLLSLLLALADKPQGVVLIDEIENGFYFDRLGSIWSLLWSVSRNGTRKFSPRHIAESACKRYSRLLRRSPEKSP